MLLSRFTITILFASAALAGCATLPVRPSLDVRCTAAQLPPAPGAPSTSDQARRPAPRCR